MIRLGIGFFFPDFLQLDEGDFPIYERAALSFLEVGRLEAPNFGPFAPGSAVFIIIAYSLFGESAFALVALQSILGGILAVSAYLLSSYFFGNKEVGYTAAILAAFLPNFLLQMVVPGDVFVLYAVLFLLGFFFFIKAVSEGKLSFAALAGVFFAANSLTEPIVFYMPLIFVLWLVVSIFMRPGLIKLKKAISVATVFIFIFGTLVSLWSVRNYYVFENQSGESSVYLIAKQEHEFLRPSRLRDFAEPFLKLDTKLLSDKFSEMLFAPHKLWLINPYPHYPSHKAILTNIFYGEAALTDVPRADLILLGVKSAATALHWLVMILGVWTLWIFRRNGIGILVFLIFAYISFVTIGFFAWKPQDTLAPLSGHFIPIFTLLAVFASYPVFRIYEKLRGRLIDSRA